VGRLSAQRVEWLGGCHLPGFSTTHFEVPIRQQASRYRVSVFAFNFAQSARSAATRAAREASTSVPVVFITGDPVEDGFVSSLSGPGGALTGLALVNTEVSQKWIELLRETLPRRSRVAALFDPNATRAQAQAVMDAARSLKIMRTWWTIRSKYSTRHWVVLCARPP